MPGFLGSDYTVCTFISYLGVVLFSTFHVIVVYLTFFLVLFLSFSAPALPSGNQINERRLFLEVKNKTAKKTSLVGHISANSKTRV